MFQRIIINSYTYFILDAETVDKIFLDIKRNDPIHVSKVNEDFLLKYQTEINKQEIIISSFSKEITLNTFLQYMNNDSYQKIVRSYAEIKYRKLRYGWHPIYNITDTETANSDQKFFRENWVFDWRIINPKMIGSEIVETKLLQSVDPQDLGRIIALNIYLEPYIFEKYEYLIDWKSLNIHTKCPIYLIEKHYKEINKFDLAYYKFTEKFYDDNFYFLMENSERNIWRVLPFKIVKKYIHQLVNANDLYLNENIPLYFLRRLKIPNFKFIYNNNIPLKFYSKNVIFSKFYKIDGYPKFKFRRQRMLEASIERLELIKIDF